MIDATAVATGFGTWFPAVNESDKLALDVGNMVEDAHELATGKVANLATPKSLHPLHVEVFKEQCVIDISQVVSQFEEPVTPPIDHCLMQAPNVRLGFFPIVAALDLARQVALCLAQFAQGLSIVQRGFNLLLIRRNEESFQPKVKACAFTRHGLMLRVDFFRNDEIKIEIPKTVPLDRDSFDVGGDVPTLAELVNLATNADSVATEQFPTCLFERETAVSFHFLETWRAGLDAVFKIAKEKLIPLVDTVNNILNRLGINQIPMCVLVQLFQPGDVLHQGVLVQALARQAIIPTMQGNAVVVNQARNVDLLVQLLILLRAPRAPVQLEFVRLDDFHSGFSATREALACA